jgi:formylmethanofuran dehydrogenase subunit E
MEVPLAKVGVLAVLLACVTTGCSTAHHHNEKHDAMNHDHPLEGPVHVTTPTHQRLYEFHGHVGPYVVLGFRAGMLAREILESPGYFDLTAAATCPLHTPMSCFLDGLQLGSGCTVGKRNLTVSAGEPIGCLFTTKSGNEVRLRLVDGLPATLRAWIEESGVEETGEKVMGLPGEELFTVERL